MPKIDNNLQIEDYSHLVNQAKKVQERYSDFTGSEKQVRELRTRLNRLSRSLNNLRKSKSKPIRANLKHFKSKIDNLRKYIKIVTDRLNKQLKKDNKNNRSKLADKLQPIMTNFCRHHHLAPLPVPDDALKKTMTKLQRYDVMLGAVKNKAHQEQLKHAIAVDGKAITGNGEIVGIGKKLTFCGSQSQLDALTKFASKNGIVLK